MRKKQIKVYLVCIISVFTWQSCKNNIVYEDHKKMETSGWKADSPVTFKVPVQDTSSVYNVYIHLRNTGDYPWRNIYFFVNTESPSEAQVTDTVEYYLADEKGKWYGKGWGQVWSHMLPYRMNVKFPYKGIYTFTIKQGMRSESLPSILDAGILLEKVNQ